MNDQLPQMNGPPPVAGLVGESLVPFTDEIEWAAVSPRQITPEDWQRFEGYLREIFEALGLAVGSAATADTPRRFLRALFDATSGYVSITLCRSSARRMSATSHTSTSSGSRS